MAAPKKFTLTKEEAMGIMRVQSHLLKLANYPVDSEKKPNLDTFADIHPDDLQILFSFQCDVLHCYCLT